MRILYNSTNHDVVCTDQGVEYTDHAVVYTFHSDNQEIDEIVIIFVYSKKNVFNLKIQTIIPSSSYGRIYQARDVRPERDGGKAGVLSDEDTTEHGYGGFRGTDHLPRIGLEQG